MRGTSFDVSVALHRALTRDTDDADRYFSLDIRAKVCTIGLATLDKTVADVTKSSIVWSAVQSPTHHPSPVVEGAPKQPVRRPNARTPLSNATFDFASWQGESTTSRIVLVGEICLPRDSDVGALNLGKSTIVEPPQPRSPRAVL